jgi:hypothetical protein
MIDQKQLENVEYFNYLGSAMTNERGTLDIKSRFSMGRAAFNKKKAFHKQMDLYLRKPLAKCYIWSIALYGVETRIFRKGDQKYLGSCHSR